MYGAGIGKDYGEGELLYGVLAETGVHFICKSKHLIEQVRVGGAVAEDSCIPHGYIWGDGDGFAIYNDWAGLQKTMELFEYIIALVFYEGFHGVHI